MLTRERKKELVANLAEDLNRSQSMIFVDFKGLNVAQMNTLRSIIREKGGMIKVVRNTLLKIAIERAGVDFIKQDDEYGIFVGPTAVIYRKEEDADILTILKDLVKFSKENESLTFKGGFVDGKLINSEQVIEYSNLPSREELLSMLLMRMQSPISGLVFTLSGVLRKFLYVLKAIEDKKSGGEQG